MATHEASSGAELLRAGSLTPEQTDQVLRALPMGISVMNTDGIIVFWQGPGFEDCDSRFIGRPAADCHSPRSQKMIDHMVEEFRARRRHEAVFVAREGGRVVINRYVPLRGDAGEYQGILETMQDVTDMGGLEERHDLDW